MFRFELNQNVVISVSGEAGVVIGRTEAVNQEANYQVRYKDAEGKAEVVWWTESSLEAADDTASNQSTDPSADPTAAPSTDPASAPTADPSTDPAPALTANPSTDPAPAQAADPSADPASASAATV